MKHIYKAVGVGVLLSLLGCNGESEKRNAQGSAGQSLQEIVGIWELGYPGYYYHINENTFDIVRFDQVFECYSTITAPIVVGENDSFVVTYNGQDVPLSYSLEEETLLLTNTDQNEVEELTRSNLSTDGFSPSCADPESTGSIDVELSFSDLPESILLNVESTGEGEIEYSVSITFDINLNGTIDRGDLAFEIKEFKFPDSTQELKDISKLDASVWVNESASRSSALVPFSYSVADDKFVFSILKSQHLSLKSISQGTPVLIETYYKFSQAGEVSDQYPDSGEFTAGLDSSLLVDVAGDVPEGGEIADLLSVSISVQD